MHFQYLLAPAWHQLLLSCFISCRWCQKLAENCSPDSINPRLHPPADPIVARLNPIFSSSEEARPLPWGCQAPSRGRERKQEYVPRGCADKAAEKASLNYAIVSSQTVDKGEGGRGMNIPRLGVNKERRAKWMKRSCLLSPDTSISRVGRPPGRPPPGGGVEAPRA